MKTTASCLAVWLFLPLSATAQSPPPAFQRSERRAPCRDYDPLRKPLFGETHSHTAYSFDAIAVGTVDRPRDAYRYAQGGATWVADAAGNPTICSQQARPLDFAVVTDHAEYFGAQKICSTKGAPGYDSAECESFRESPGNPVGTWIQDLANDPPTPPAFCGPDNAGCRAWSSSIWEDIQAAAEEAYDRGPACRFTTFVGYEWTAFPGMDNLHRNVIFRNARVPKLPISTFDTGSDQRKLWARLQAECLDTGDGCDVLTIPHNGNLSNGRLFTIQENTAAYARLHSFWEPLSEIQQGKGNSECRTGTGTDDPECGFEQMPFHNLSLTVDDTPFAPNAFLRNVLKSGLAQEAKVGANPFKLGFVGGLDTHNATPGATDEASFVGLHGLSDAGPEGLLGEIYFNPGALTVVWAEENSRDAIFEAMRRRETYATSGTRPVVRFFAGWDLPRDLCSRGDFVRVGYDRGVPMGADLPPRPTGAARSPRFAVMAMMDPGSVGSSDAFPQVCAAHHPAAKLQRIEIVKGWIDVQGAQHEKVVSVAGGADPGAGVDPVTCDPVGPGHNALCSVWQDPDFDPTQPAFYYARVLENPTCRWSTYVCKQAGLDPFRPEECARRLEKYSPAAPPSASGASTRSPREAFSICCTMKPGPVVQPAEIPRVTQERAWTSPVWYSPPGGGRPSTRQAEEP